MCSYELSLLINEVNNKRSCVNLLNARAKKSGMFQKQLEAKAFVGVSSFFGLFSEMFTVVNTNFYFVKHYNSK